MNLTESIQPRSDQVNADDLVGGPATYTIREVRQGAAEQPFDFMLVETDRAYRPSKTMRRLIVAAWGPDANAYVGRRLTLYREPTIKFGGATVGGIRISHMSHIDKRVEDKFQVTRGKRETFHVDPLPDLPATPAPVETPLLERISRAIAAFGDLGVTVEMLETRVGPNEKWSAAELDLLTPIIMALKSGATSVEAEFASAPTQAPA